MQSGNGTRDCDPALQLTEDISNMHCDVNVTDLLCALMQRACVFINEILC